MIDLHCHILPGMDDGPSALAQSLQMAKKAVAGGIRTVVATPHADTGMYCFSPADIDERVASFKASLSAASIPLEVYPGAEVQLSPGLVDRHRQGKVTTINNSRYILLELPSTILPDSCKRELLNLLSHDFIPIIAHPELHFYLQKNFAYLLELVHMGVLCQVTAQSLLGNFGRQVTGTTEQMLQKGLSHIIASDAHGAEGRVPDLEKAVSAAAQLLKSREKAMQMVTDLPAAILADRNVYVELPAMNEENGRKTQWQQEVGARISSIAHLWTKA